ncbi:hypothetical protein BD310DRAFT_917928 [Dichomitus squalens]|uniref:Uncharacterized protein n=1 Tax=Dichomitus squalens TaxID=114155 RepID=A0A4Q9Q697_9APHY|nr:hypothetical protein BD310DRAFT_917928 [Dichomitus squalens]
MRDEGEAGDEAADDACSDKFKWQVMRRKEVHFSSSLSLIYVGIKVILEGRSVRASVRC